MQGVSPTPQVHGHEQKLGIFSVSSFVVANMIGTGVFTSLGFQLLAISNPWVILSLWFLGGMLAFLGALIYAELGSIMPRSGGEYTFLSQLFHPSIGFVAGWISVTVGFAAPVAAACVALSKYVEGAFGGTSPELTAVVTLLFLTAIHSFSISLGGIWQTGVTALKVLLILLFVVMGLTMAPNPQDFADSFDWGALFSPSYPVALVWVMFAYSGWNAATYIAGDMAQPQKNLPPALLISTLSVTIMYVLLNAAFLYATPHGLLVGQVEIGNIAAVSIFGAEGGRVMSGVIALLLISSISAMIYVGPRVAQAMGKDMKLLKPLAKTSFNAMPLNAIWLQCALSLLFIMTASFESIINFTGFVMNLCTLMVAVGLLMHRKKYPQMERPFRMWACPVLALLFVGIMGWILIYLLLEKPVESLCGLALVGLGFLVYFGNTLMKKLSYILPLVFLVLCAGVLESRADMVSALPMGIRHNVLNQTARMVAGMNNPADTLHEKVRAMGAWQKYCQDSDAMWLAYYKKNSALLEWVTNEVHPVTRGITSLFYPFSGPDFLYANLLFPDTRVIYAIGLEQLGTVPQFTTDNTLADNVGKYRASIREVLTDSYYRTKNMARDLNNATVDGVIPVIMLFMARSQMYISQINYVTLAHDGSIIMAAEKEIAKQINRGVEFKYYSNNDDVERKFYYFRIDIQDKSLDKNYAAKSFLQSLCPEATFSKSASYLMHSKVFSVVRDTVLESSKLIIADDSAIPFKYYKSDIWDIRLYGKYTKPVDDFKYIYEPDLVAAYNDPHTVIKPLGFRMGYCWNSNMRMALRRDRSQ